MTHGSLFSGIGGFDLAAEWMGWENVFHCEIAEFPRKVLKYHFPKSICYEDIKKTDFTKHRGKIDIISGGFPCQPYSNAGKRKGKEDDRHLWPEMLRVIREIQPRFVVGENVSGLLTWNNGMVFHEIITDLENEGYETQAFLIPACATNAPHRRDRIWFVAHANNTRTNERMQFDGKRTENDKQWRGQSQFEYCENGSDGITAHSNGTEQGNDIGENIGEKGEIRWAKESNVFGELCRDGNVADTNSKRHTSYGKSKSIERNWSGNNREQKEWSEQTERVNGLDGLSRITTDTDSTDNKTQSQKRILGQKNKKQSTRGLINGYTRTQWNDFPTQSPVCGGDDGISTRLDGIAFSKWRNESIKGYGNAVVPQVVYRIFSAIEQSIL